MHMLVSLCKTCYIIVHSYSKFFIPSRSVTSSPSYVFSLNYQNFQVSRVNWFHVAKYLTVVFIVLRSCYVASFEFVSAVGLLMTIPFLAEVMLCRVYIVSEVHC